MSIDGVKFGFGFYFLIFILYHRRCVVIIIIRDMRVAGTNGDAGGRQGELPRVHGLRWANECSRVFTGEGCLVTLRNMAAARRSFLLSKMIV